MKTRFIVILITFFIYSFSLGYANNQEEYYNESVTAFKNSPSLFQIEKIEDENQQYCEQVYLEATRRREYTEGELEKCSDIFEIKRQQEIDFMYHVLGKRGIFY